MGPNQTKSEIYFDDKSPPELYYMDFGPYTCTDLHS